MNKRLCFLTLTLLVIFILKIEAQISAIETVFSFLSRGQNDLNLESQDDYAKFLKEYDFIIVGAGTAGCALAARLSENPKWNVLLLEAGGPESYIMDVPVLAHFLQLGEMNWKYRTQPSNRYCLGLNNNRCNWPRGKVMGGSSVLNYMFYTRGNYRDYDRWAELGNEGWAYEDVLPYFKKYEGSTVPIAEAEYVGRNGPVKISFPPYRTQLADAFLRAAQEDGLKFRDYNGEKQVGVSYMQTTTYKGIRWSSNRAYLYSIKGKRPNLHIRKYSLVTKIIIEPVTKRTQGVIFSKNDQSFEVKAKREVILSAGAINTPQLLMLSGIGPAKHLRVHGIKPIADLAVGFNLQDHYAPAVAFTTNVSTLKTEDFFEVSNVQKFLNHTGIFSLPGGCETIAFFDLDHPEKGDDGYPDMEFFLSGGGLTNLPPARRAFGFTNEVFRSLFLPLQSKDSFLIFPMILRPKSRGRIMLKSADPFKFPLLYANYLSHPYDLDISVRGIQRAISLLERPSFKRINASLPSNVIAGCEKYTFGSRAYWECYVRHMTLTIYHYSGTAKMGPITDRSAVVDPRLRVYGIKNLRVVDASIMPELISGHPNGPVFMIAEKAADMIKEDNNFV